MDRMLKDRMLQFFSYTHLPAHLQEVSKPFCDLATRIVDTLPSNPERSVALRKLLEAKDAAVRASLFVHPVEEPSEYPSPFSKPNMNAASGMGIQKH